MKIVWVLLCLLGVQATGSIADASEDHEGINLKKLVVKGTVPGPDLWRVTDGEHELWILGTLSPLPKKMRWNSQHVEQILKHSRAIIMPPSLFISLEDVGFVKKLSLVKSAMGVKKNPDKEKLIDVLPDHLYSRWLTLKQEYIGNSRRIEKQRPLFASRKLYDEALSDHGLTQKTGVIKKLHKIAKKNDVEIIRPQIKVSLSDPKQLAKDFKKAQLQDIACFSQTLGRIESDLPAMKKRALAWSYGDVKTIESLPYVDNDSECTSAILDSSVIQDLGVGDRHARLKKEWLDAARAALESNQSTLAVMPISYLFNEDGVLSVLESQGYQIEVPSTLMVFPDDDTEELK